MDKIQHQKFDSFVLIFVIKVNKFNLNFHEYIRESLHKNSFLITKSLEYNSSIYQIILSFVALNLMCLSLKQNLIFFYFIR